MRHEDDANTQSPPGDPVEIRLEGDSVEFLDFSPEFVEAFSSKEIAFFAEGDEEI